MSEMKNILVSYLRDNKSNPRGVLVALKRQDGTIGINYSFCRKSDRFQKEIGLKIAMGRAIVNNDNSFQYCPHEVFKRISEFVKRSSKYYKVEENFILENNPRFHSYHLNVV